MENESDKNVLALSIFTGIYLVVLLVKATLFSTPESHAMRECIQTAPEPVCKVQLGLMGK